MNTSTAIFGAETVFRNNYASGAGGAIFNDFAYIIASEAENIKFIGNESSNNGGALYSNEGESIFKGNTLFENNASTGAGGAIYIGNNSKLHLQIPVPLLSVLIHHTPLTAEPLRFIHLRQYLTVQLIS